MNQEATFASPVIEPPDLSSAVTGTPPADGPASSPASASLATAAPVTSSPAPNAPFAHRAEAEFAQLLDYYQIEWRYEPDVFPLEWEGDRVVRQFRPDFYLPEYDLYVELTVMKQSLVRRKNRKLRLLRELYPGIQIKLLYRRDFHRLLAAFGVPTDEIEAAGAAGALSAGRAA